MSEKEFGNLTTAVSKVLEKPGVAVISGLMDFYASGLNKYMANELCRVDKLRTDPGVRQKESMVIRKSGSFKEFFAYQYDFCGLDAVVINEGTKIVDKMCYI